MQSAGWLVVRGYKEYLSGPATFIPTKDRFSGWKVGAYEPTTQLHGDVEYIYIIDLVKAELSCVEPNGGFWDNSTLENTRACKKFKKVKF
jgi:hypothetical protein